MIPIHQHESARTRQASQFRLTRVRDIAPLIDAILPRSIDEALAEYMEDHPNAALATALWGLGSAERSALVRVMDTLMHRDTRVYKRVRFRFFWGLTHRLWHLAQDLTRRQAAQIEREYETKRRARRQAAQEAAHTMSGAGEGI